MTENNDSDKFEQPGERLNHILDNIKFKSGRGRATDFKILLQEKCPDIFGQLNYTTAKSWFGVNAPPMEKISKIIDVLDSEYGFKYDLNLIKSWWKLGGFYPFGDADSRDISEGYIEKLQYKVMALISQEAKDEFENLTIDRLDEIKIYVTKFAHDFVNPNNNECPEEYLKIIIGHLLKEKG